jgi:hypothetical protein
MYMPLSLSRSFSVIAPVHVMSMSDFKNDRTLLVRFRHISEKIGTKNLFHVTMPYNDWMRFVLHRTTGMTKQRLRRRMTLSQEN